eukprot:CAMPEP_0197184720 /NCGR_PEP_ID=MMETSP1423-20130617/10413_1 /TAXON_ID=476441 /ORGANISM="Pseudo-nitzschia heimii, Strain UNC1101" /LENGTH=996 /DNA_ID=CAMNT_0042635603 /DNA_START=373 /DNA_END=3363 /DNA_ORIENTATION=-
MATDTSMDSSVYATPPSKAGDFNDNEMQAIERLASREAYDEDLENIHATLSKRGTLRTSLSSTRSNPLPMVNVRSSSTGKQDERAETSIRGTKRSVRRSSHSGRQSEQERDKTRSTRSSRDRDNNGDNASTNGRRRRRRRSSRAEDMLDDGGRPVRSNSAIERLLEYNEPGSISTTSNHSNQEKKSSMNPLLLGLSKSRDNGKVRSGASVSSANRQRTKSRDRQNPSVGREARHKPTARGSSVSRGSKVRTRSISKSRARSKSTSRARARSKSTSRARSKSRSRPVNEHEDASDPKKPLRRQQSSSSRLERRVRGVSVDRNNGVTRILRATKSLRTTRSYMNEQDMFQQEHHGVPDDPFEKIWGTKPTSDDLNQTNASRGSTSSVGTDADKASLSPRDYSGGKTSVSESPLYRTKKTKLEKIHELQGKCDRYKIELNTKTEEWRMRMLELDDCRGEVASLQKKVSLSEQQSAKFKARVFELENELDEARAEQRTERAELSEAAKDLARVNIDYAKSVDEARLLREKLDGLQGLLSQREEKISVLEKDLETSDENVRQLEADLLYADGQINSLEAEMSKVEKELNLYAEAVERDSLRDAGNEADGLNLREAKIEAEKQRCEDREKQLEEQKRMLDEKNRILERERKEFEVLRSQQLEEQQRREREFEENRAREDDNRIRAEINAKQSDDDRVNKEEELHKLLNALENENVALNGRLKSEQLDSTIKIQNKEKSIAGLQTELSRLTNELKERVSAPDSSPTLRLEIENMKIEAENRKIKFKDVQTKKIELEKQIEGLQNTNTDIKTRLSNFEAAVGDQKREFENQKRKALEWQKKTGEWSEKAIVWKQKAEHWEKKAKEVNNDSASFASEDAAQAEPQALFLAAAVEKKASGTSAANVNGSWRLGRRIFGMTSDGEDETQPLISKLEGENVLKQNEIKNLKSEIIRIQSRYKEQAYSKVQECEKLQNENATLEFKNENLMKELELARKLNRTISDLDD